LSLGDYLEFKEISQLTNTKWEYEFYKEEIYRYHCFAIEPHPTYVIRALYYSNGYLLTLARLDNEEDFRDKPELLAALKMGPFDGHRDTIEKCMNDTLWKIGNAIEQALKV
jgi:hypothetical protein